MILQTWQIVQEQFTPIHQEASRGHAFYSLIKMNQGWIQDFRWGAPTLQRGVPTYEHAKHFWKTAWNQENFERRWGAPGAPRWILVILIQYSVHLKNVKAQLQPASCTYIYRSGTVNSKTVNSKFHLIQSFCEISAKSFPTISCLKCTVNSNFHLIRSKTLWTNDFELTVPDLYHNKFFKSRHFVCLTSCDRNYILSVGASNKGDVSYTLPEPLRTTWPDFFT